MNVERMQMVIIRILAFATFILFPASRLLAAIELIYKKCYSIRGGKTTPLFTIPECDITWGVGVNIRFWSARSACAALGLCCGTKCPLFLKIFFLSLNVFICLELV